MRISKGAPTEPRCLRNWKLFLDDLRVSIQSKEGAKYIIDELTVERPAVPVVSLEIALSFSRFREAFVSSMLIL